MDECIDKNRVDKDEYPLAAEDEARCVRVLADLWNSPTTVDKVVAASTTGSSEAAMLGDMGIG